MMETALQRWSTLNFNQYNNREKSVLQDQSCVFLSYTKTKDFKDTLVRKILKTISIENCQCKDTTVKGTH